MNRFIANARYRAEQAQAKADHERERLQAVVIREIEAGKISESEAARQVSVSRSTIRRWLGKHTWRDQHGKA